jgi:outer membrane immunogenic protein
MKRIAIALLAGVAAVAGLGYSASAADLAVKAAPAPVYAPSWTGFYVGVHAGAAWQSTPRWTFQDPNGALLNTAVVDSNSLGAVGGLQGGYNYQFAPAWVVGVEGDISWASLSDHRAVNLQNAAGVNAATLQMAANTQWMASARAKLGFTGWLNNTMLFVTGGGAWAGVEYNADAKSLNPAVAPFAVNTTEATINTTTVKSGWVLGGGAEWMATTNILLRAEYLYYSFGSGQNLSNVFQAPAVAALAAPVNFNFASYNVQVFRIAGSYKF